MCITAYSKIKMILHCFFVIIREAYSFFSFLKSLSNKTKMSKVGLLTGNITYRANHISLWALQVVGQGLYSIFIQQRVIKLKKKVEVFLSQG